MVVVPCSRCLFRKVCSAAKCSLFSTLRKHYCHITAYMPCVTINLATAGLFCPFQSVFSSWERSHDSLYYPPFFLSFKMCFSYFSPTISYYHLTLLVYKNVVVHMWGLEQTTFNILWTLLWGSFSFHYILLLINFSSFTGKD